MTETIFFLLFSYLLGSIPFGYLVCRLFRGIDIRKCGSGNIGATNVYRVAGISLAAVVLFLDIIKGLLPVIIGRRFFLDLHPAWLVLIGCSAVIGHTFSIFLKGSGGKGVATSFGVIIGLFPMPALFAFMVWTVLFLLTGYVSAGSVAAAAFLPVFIHLLQGGTVYILTGVFIAVLIVLKHKKNIIRIIEGKENRINLPWIRLK